MSAVDLESRTLSRAPRARTIRAAVLDDEALSRRRIRTLIAAEPDIELVAEYGRVSDAIAGLTASPVDLLFLDIRMPRASGFEVLGRLSPRPAVIFATAHEEHALDAFNVGAIDYLLKPFDDERFRQSVDRIRTLLRPLREVAAGRESEPPADTARRPFLRRLAVKSGGAVVFLRIDEVDYFETAGNYVRIHVKSASFLQREALARLEEQLDPGQFVRVNRSVVLNIDRVTRLLPTFDGDHVVELRDGTRLTLLAKYRQRMQQVAGRF